MAGRQHPLVALKPRSGYYPLPNAILVNSDYHSGIIIHI